MTIRRTILSALLTLLLPACGAVEQERCSEPLFCADGLACFTHLPDTSGPTTTSCRRPCSHEEKTGCPAGQECFSCDLHCRNEVGATGFCVEKR